MISCLLIGTGLVLDPSGSQQYDILPDFSLLCSSGKKAEKVVFVLQQSVNYGGLDISLNVVIGNRHTIFMGNFLEGDSFKARTGD
jgi:hypothetical protein